MISKSPEDVSFSDLSLRTQAAKLRELSMNRLLEADQNEADGFREIAEVQVRQAYELEERARVIETSLRRRNDSTD
jgi:hypothetical protein